MSMHVFRLLGSLPLSLAIGLGLAGCAADQPPVAPRGEENVPVAESAPATAVAPKGIKPGWRPINELPQATASSRCHIDSLGAVEGANPAKVKRGETLAAHGWVASKDGTAVPPQVMFRMEDGNNNRAWEANVPTGVGRQDVADSSGNPALATSGFSVVVDTSELVPTSYHVYLAFTHDGKDYLCDGGHQVIVE